MFLRIICYLSHYLLYLIIQCLYVFQNPPVAAAMTRGAAAAIKGSNLSSSFVFLRYIYTDKEEKGQLRGGHNKQRKEMACVSPFQACSLPMDVTLVQEILLVCPKKRLPRTIMCGPV